MEVVGQAGGDPTQDSVVPTQGRAGSPCSTGPVLLVIAGSFREWKLEICFVCHGLIVPVGWPDVYEV
jgi:hypothetical protein